MKHKRISSALLALLLITSCTEFLDPLNLGWINDENVWVNTDYTHGVLDYVYSDMADNWETLLGIESEYHTDNAVHNSSSSDFAARGGSSSSYPVGEWDNAYANILHINQYLENGLDIPWSGTNLELDSVAKLRYYGEAHFLRAWNEALLLKQYAGPDASAQNLLGIPLIRKVYKRGEYADLPRESYEKCLEFILNDLDTALAYLPLKFKGPISSYDSDQKRGRADQRAAASLKARVLLFAACEAYNPQQNNEKWIQAARACFEAIQLDGGLQTMEAYGEFNNTDNDDDFWRTSYSSSNSLEQDHFPPSRYGEGKCNPSQNLVDAFPMANGYPINEPGSGYDANNPFAGRDDRFYSFIFFNGDLAFENFDPVETFIGGKDDNGVLRSTSTRTGYFMKRYLSNIAVGKDPRILEGAGTKTQKFAVLLDRAELYLNFAEAANEISGSDPQTPALDFDISALDALMNIRSRGGSNDYIDALIGGGQLSQDKFRDLVRNERRIELCFRGHRYWDLRRWKMTLEEINAMVLGVEITKTGLNSYDYNFNMHVESRGFRPNTYYGPIPLDEIANSNVLIQNSGW